MNETQVETPFLTYLLSTKAAVNLSKVRERVLNVDDIVNTDKVTSYQQKYGHLEFDTERAQYDSLNTLRKEYKEKEMKLRTRRYSIDFDNAQTGLEMINTETSQSIRSTGNDHNDDNVQALRERLLGNRQSRMDLDENGIVKSVDKQIEDQDNMQNELVDNMSKLVHNLKEGAVAFQNALDEDKKVLGAAEIGIQVASRGLLDVTGKLTKYDKKKLGYMFYITVFLFMFVGLILTFIIIKLFPAL
ncbi:similar to Saccharomyces cerevisiae YGL098W USE1 Essential SNARE protein localized to the ER, involved in retrograde traffic from the Golgi to the ER [Maudiozyma saulgeensis]|uniref:Similar to Saccharomyces cerevisiae YGL098W USE1 Essential SNARE protein localized to the ER, involved in retrograde traffic from the Golgi to the ER n=1 Tax=Maudiozyma saulgeensis TaxID=1789683 RepID=A0A1X7QZW8_9SACH|nr:similar to Saccharomyces cerevisiae YGL098W USE1 Essential SNARE protein localized to the ER, involved in retrograde traffic from the Golgi to the ER [Kazachstania saulgeensis]